VIPLGSGSGKPLFDLGSVYNSALARYKQLRQPGAAQYSWFDGVPCGTALLRGTRAPSLGVAAEAVRHPHQKRLHCLDVYDA
jgi:hypothetical protein